MWLDTLNAMKKKSGKTSEQISAESGIPKGTLNKIFAGQTADPKYSTLSSLVHCLGYTVDDLEIPVEELGLNKKTSPTPAQAEAEEVEKWLTDLLVERGYIRPGEDISDRDARFLIYWIGILDAWFEKE